MDGRGTRRGVAVVRGTVNRCCESLAKAGGDMEWSSTDIRQRKLMQCDRSKRAPFDPRAGGGLLRCGCLRVFLGPPGREVVRELLHFHWIERLAENQEMVGLPELLGDLLP